MTSQSTSVLLFLSFFILVSQVVSSSSTSDASESDSDVFTCAGKVIGGYYADVQEKCQMFHVCTIGENEEIRDIVFRCLNGTVFDQETRVCERTEEVDCSKTTSFYHLNNELYGPGIIPDSAMDLVEARTPTSQQQVLDPSDALNGVAALGSLSFPEDTLLPEEPPTLPQIPISSQTTLPPTLLPRDVATSTTHMTTSTTPSSRFLSQSKSVFNIQDISKPNFSSDANEQPPFTVTRIASSTSVSASARVHIQTPISRFSLRQGSDYRHTPLPAPHLRPSLLKLAAAQAMAERARNRRTRSTSNRQYTRQPIPYISSVPSSSSVLSISYLFPDVPSTLLHEKNSQIKYFFERLLNNLRLRSRFFEPRFRSALKQGAQGQTHRQKFRDTKTTTMNDTQFRCEGNDGKPAFYGDYYNHCKSFHLCLPSTSQRDPERTFVCADEGFVFNAKEGKCSESSPIECSSSSPPFTLPEVDGKFSPVDTASLCRFWGKGSLLLDTLNGCDQFLQCPNDDQPFVQVRRCPDGFLFSQQQLKCAKAQEVDCTRDRYSLLLKMSQMNNILEEINQKLKTGDGNSEQKLNALLMSQNLNHIKSKDLKRQRRALTFEVRNPHREASNGALTNVAGIFSEHTAVIDAQSPGNVINGKATLAEFPGKSEDKNAGRNRPLSPMEVIFGNKESQTSFQPQTSLAFNTTSLNGTTIEVSEIASPDQVGKVTITSIVPNIVRQNGNGGKQQRTSTINVDLSDGINHSVNVAMGQSKVSLSGINSPDSERTNNEAPNEDKNETTTMISAGESSSELGVTDKIKSEIEQSTEKQHTLDETSTNETGLLETDLEITTLISVEREASLMITTASSEVAETSTKEKIPLTTAISSTTTVSTTAAATTTSTTTPTTTTTTTTTTTAATTSSTTTPTTTTSTIIETTTSVSKLPEEAIRSETTSTTEVAPSADDGSPKTNFTCKDKELEQFYPDIENNCRLFHYCSPGFSDDEVLYLTFVCSGDTRFDIRTKKCQDMSSVVCGPPEITTSTLITPTQSTTGTPPATTVASPPITTAAPTIPSTTTTSTTPSTTTASTTPSTTTASTTPSTTTESTTPSTTTASTAPSTIPPTTTISPSTTVVITTPLSELLTTEELEGRSETITEMNEAKSTLLPTLEAELELGTSLNKETDEKESVITEASMSADEPLNTGDTKPDEPFSEIETLNADEINSTEIILIQTTTDTSELISKDAVRLEVSLTTQGDLAPNVKVLEPSQKEQLNSEQKIDLEKNSLHHTTIQPIVESTSHIISEENTKLISTSRDEVETVTSFSESDTTEASTTAFVTDSTLGVVIEDSTVINPAESLKVGDSPP